MSSGTRSMYSNTAVAISAANVNVITAVVVPDGVNMITVWAQPSSATVINVIRLNVAAVSKTLGMNTNVACAAGALVAFDVKVNPRDTISIQVENWVTGMVFDTLDIEGVYSGVR